MSDSWVEEMKASDEYRQALRRSLDHLKACRICTPFKRCPERKALLQAEVEIENKFRQGNAARRRLQLIGRAEKDVLAAAASPTKEQAHRRRPEDWNRPPSESKSEGEGEGGQMRTSVTPLHDKADIDGLTLPELERLIGQRKLEERQNFIKFSLGANENADKSPRGVAARVAKRRGGKGSKKSKARSK